MVLFKLLLIIVVFLTPLYFIPVGMCALAFKFAVQASWKKETTQEVMWIPMINIFEGVAGLIALIETPFKLQKKYNQGRHCDKCGVVSYYGRALIHHQFNGTTMICPCCENSQSYLYGTDNPVVIGTKLSAWEACNLHHSISNIGKLKVKYQNLDYIDSQMEKYLAVQEKKLVKMNRKEEI